MGITVPHKPRPSSLTTSNSDSFFLGGLDLEQALFSQGPSSHLFSLVSFTLSRVVMPLMDIPALPVIPTARGCPLESWSGYGLDLS
jgi:hypothetical protein